MNFTVIRAYFAHWKSLVLDRFTPNTGELLASLAKLEVKIERSIEKTYRGLRAMQVARNRLDNQIVETNASLDGAYKLLHKVTDLSR